MYTWGRTDDSMRQLGLGQTQVACHIDSGFLLSDNAQSYHCVEKDLGEDEHEEGVGKKMKPTGAPGWSSLDGEMKKIEALLVVPCSEDNRHKDAGTFANSPWVPDPAAGEQAVNSSGWGCEPRDVEFDMVPGDPAVIEMEHSCPARAADSAVVESLLLESKTDVADRVGHTLYSDLAAAVVVVGVVAHTHLSPSQVP